LWLSQPLSRLERMFSMDGLEAVVGELQAAVADDPAGVDAGPAVRMFDLFAQAERLGSAGKLLWARRVEDSSAYGQDGGVRSVESATAATAAARQAIEPHSDLAPLIDLSQRPRTRSLDEVRADQARQRSRDRHPATTTSKSRLPTSDRWS
jgi:hypothetical protein